MAISVDGQRTVIDSRTLALCPPGSSITYTWDPASIRLGYVHYTSSEPERSAVYRLDADSVVPHLLRHLLWLGQAQPSEWLDTFTRGFDYVLDLLRTGHTGGRLRDPIPHSQLVVQAMTWVGDLWLRGPMRSPTLEDLASAVNTTPRHLSRVFTEQLGVPPHRALLLIRLHHAGVLLRTTRTTLAVIARTCGFARESQFSTAFKKEAAVPPTSFRTTSEIEFVLPATLRPLAAYLCGTPSSDSVDRGPVRFRDVVPE